MTGSNVLPAAEKHNNDAASEANTTPTYEPSPSAAQTGKESASDQAPPQKTAPAVAAEQPKTRPLPNTRMGRSFNA